MPTLRRALAWIALPLLLVVHARAAVPGCTGTSRIAGCHALVQTPRGAVTDVSLAYVIAPGLGYVQPRIERVGGDVVRVYFIDSDFIVSSPREARTLPLGAFTAGQYRIEIYEGNAGPPPPLPPSPPQQVALLGLAVAGAIAVPAVDPAGLLIAVCALGVLGGCALRRRG